MNAPRIAEPCHASWSDMTPTQAGRHCATCDQTVVDVSAMSPDCARTYLQHELPTRLARGERVCVRAHADRRGRPLRPGVKRRLLTNGLALMLTAVGGFAGLDAAEEIQQPVMGRMCAPEAIPQTDPLAARTDATSGLTVRVEVETKLLIASDAAGAERWRLDLAGCGMIGKPVALALKGQIVTVSAADREVSVDIRNGGVYDK